MKQLLVIVMMIIPLGVSQANAALGRLFFTPAERQQINANRLAVKSDTSKNKITVIPTKIELKGYLKRKGHKDVVWINDKNNLDKSKSVTGVEALGMNANGTVSIKVKDKKSIRLKPGQNAVLNESNIKENYE